MDPMAQELRRSDEVVGKKVKSRLKKDFCEELEKIGINTRRKTIKEI